MLLRVAILCLLAQTAKADLAPPAPEAPSVTCGSARHAASLAALERWCPGQELALQGDADDQRRTARACRHLLRGLRRCDDEIVLAEPGNWRFDVAVPKRPGERWQAWFSGTARRARVESL